MRIIVKSDKMAQRTNNVVSCIPVIEARSWRLTTECQLNYTKELIKKAHATANTKQQCMSEIAVDDFLDLNTADKDTGKTIRELFLDWEVPKRDRDGKHLNGEDGEPVMVKGIALVEPGWGGGYRIIYYKVHMAEVLDFIKASGLLLAKKHSETVYRLYSQGAMSRFDGMYLDDHGHPKSKEDNLIKESLQAAEEWVDMGLIKAAEAERQAEGAQGEAVKKARFALDHYNPDDANSVKSVYTSGENRDVAQGPINLPEPEESTVADDNSSIGSISIAMKDAAMHDALDDPENTGAGGGLDNPPPSGDHTAAGALEASAAFPL